MHSRAIFVAAAFTALAGAAWADTQNFTVNAQYRGMVKKAFRDIGTGVLNDNGQATGDVHIQGHSRVDHPQQEGRVYDLNVDTNFRIQGNSIQELSDHSTCNAGSEEALKTTQKVAPFVHIAKWIKDDQSTGQTFTTPRGTFNLRLAQTDRNLEATLYEGEQMVGKFFMVAGRRAAPAREVPHHHQGWHEHLVRLDQRSRNPLNTRYTSGAAASPLRTKERCGCL